MTRPGIIPKIHTYFEAFEVEDHENLIGRWLEVGSPFKCVKKHTSYIEAIDSNGEDRVFNYVDFWFRKFSKKSK